MIVRYVLMRYEQHPPCLTWVLTTNAGASFIHGQCGGKYLCRPKNKTLGFQLFEWSTSLCVFMILRMGYSFFFFFFSLGLVGLTGITW
jgi:hypothetical protein